ncbi:MAG: hypothetical protein JSR37_09055 [Verrucomicrobia bacterium]|nr:hypothetical protein [Verrucomicrobiota bacterium]
MCPLSVFTQEKWDFFFSEEKYQKAKAEKKPVAEFMIALGKPDSEVMQAVRNDPTCLKNPCNFFKLSVLTLAIMKGRDSLIEPLVQKGASLSDEDLFGWRPVHHAALAGDHIFKIVIGQKADTKVKTRAGATCDDIRRYAGIDVADATNRHAKVALEQFGMTRYSDYPYYPQEMLQKLWQTKPQDVGPVSSEQFDKALEHGVKVDVREVGLSVKSWGAFAAEKFEAGRILFAYSGEYGEWKDKMNMQGALVARATWQRYQLGTLNAERVGNVARFLNDGFPNCLVIGSPLYRGCDDWKFFVVCEKGGINPGEELLWDYGLGECMLKWNSLYTIPNRHKMHEFIKSTTTEFIDSYIKRHSFDWNPGLAITRKNHDAHLQAAGYLTQIWYCFTTPLATLDLWCESLITAEQWFKSLKYFSKNHPIAKTAVHRNSLALVVLFHNSLVQLEELLKTQKPARIKEIKGWLSERLSTRTAMELSEIIVKLVIWLNNPVRDSWDDFSSALDKMIPHNLDRDITQLSLVKSYTNLVTSK